MVQIKQKRGTGVESPSPKSFSGGYAYSKYILHTKEIFCTLNQEYAYTEDDTNK